MDLTQNLCYVLSLYAQDRPDEFLQRNVHTTISMLKKSIQALENEIYQCKLSIEEFRSNKDNIASGNIIYQYNQLNNLYVQIALFENDIKHKNNQIQNYLDTLINHAKYVPNIQMSQIVQDNCASKESALITNPAPESKEKNGTFKVGLYTNTPTSTDDQDSIDQHSIDQDSSDQDSSDPLFDLELLFNGDQLSQANSSSSSAMVHLGRSPPSRSYDNIIPFRYTLDDDESVNSNDFETNNLLEESFSKYEDYVRPSKKNKKPKDDKITKANAHLYY